MNFKIVNAYSMFPWLFFVQTKSHSLKVAHFHGSKYKISSILFYTNKNILKATTNLKIYQNLFKYGFTLFHFAMDDPVVSGIKIFATLIVRSQAKLKWQKEVVQCWTIS